MNYKILPEKLNFQLIALRNDNILTRQHQNISFWLHQWSTFWERLFISQYAYILHNATKKYFFRVAWDFLSVYNDIAYADSEYAIRIFPSRTDFFKMTFEYFNEILLVYIL